MKNLAIPTTGLNKSPNSHSLPHQNDDDDDKPCPVQLNPGLTEKYHAARQENHHRRRRKKTRSTHKPRKKKPIRNQETEGRKISNTQEATDHARHRTRFRSGERTGTRKRGQMANQPSKPSGSVGEGGREGQGAGKRQDARRVSNEEHNPLLPLHHFLFNPSSSAAHARRRIKLNGGVDGGGRRRDLRSPR